MTKPPNGGLSVWIILKTLKTVLNNSFFNYPYFLSFMVLFSSNKDN